MPYENFSWIDGRLAIGAGVREVDGDFPFDAVLSLERYAPVALRELIQSGRIPYVWHPIIDAYAWEDHDAIVRRFDDAAAQIDAWLREGKRVLVHCREGISRSVVAVLRYLTRYEGCGWDEALALVQRSRPQARPNIRFEIALRVDAGETFTRDELEAMIRAWSTRRKEESGEETAPEEIWQDLARQGTLARMVNSPPVP